jgi:hypothetical protein
MTSSPVSPCHRIPFQCDAARRKFFWARSPSAWLRSRAGVEHSVAFLSIRRHVVEICIMSIYLCLANQVTSLSPS